MNNTFKLYPRQYQNFVADVVMAGSPVLDEHLNLTREVVNAHLTLANPIDRLVTNRARKMNLPFAFAEFLSQLIACDDIGMFKQFIGDYDRFSSDGKTLDGAYGVRINSQINEAIIKLRKNPSTRQAVVTIYDENDSYGAGKLNTPCTLSWQFLIRHGELDMITTMRSNDVYKGLTYDLFNFTMVQEYVARRVKVGLGTYYHNAGSLHVYNDDRKRILAMYKAATSHWDPPMLPMTKLDADDMVKAAYAYREMGNYGPESRVTYVLRDFSSPYAKDMICCAHAFVIRKEDPEYADEVVRLILDPALRRTMRMWVPVYKGNK